MSVISQPLVVGVDGSEASDAAVRYAAREAASRRLPLALVHCWQPFSAWAVEKAARALLQRAAAIVESAARRAEHEAFLLQGSPETCLAEASVHALLLIVGGGSQVDRGSGRVGSVALGLVAQARCPVAVVPVAQPVGGDVVVGIDGSATSEDAVAFAFEHASRTGVSVWAVFAFAPKEAPVGLDESVFADARKNAQRQLSEALAGWAEKYPDVTLNEIVSNVHPSGALRAAAKDAALLVVGSHGRGTFMRYALGSVSSDLLRSPPCTVVVVGPAGSAGA